MAERSEQSKRISAGMKRHWAQRKGVRVCDGGKPAMTDEKRKRFLNGAHYAAFGDVMMDPRENNAIVRRIIDLCMSVERGTAWRCAEIVADTDHQYCGSLYTREDDSRATLAEAVQNIRREFGLEDGR